MSIQLNLSMVQFATGCSSGIILSLGEQETEAICFSDGRALLNTHTFSNCCTDSVLNLFKRKLVERTADEWENKSQADVKKTLSQV